MAQSKPVQPSQSKRKSQASSTKPADPGTSQKQQQTISSLLATSQRKRPLLTSAVPDLSPNSKRRRTDSSPKEPEGSLPPKMASVESMYNFGGQSVTIDLTSSPPNRRRSSKVGGLRSIQPNVGPKKLVVKNLKATKSDPTRYCDQITTQLHAALTAIYNDQTPALSNEELYKGVENMCKLGRAEAVSQLLMQRCKEHVQNDLRPPLQRKAHEQPTAVLKEAVATWSRWMKQISIIRSVFFFLDRSHLLPNSSPSIYETAVSQFRSYIYSENALQYKILDGTYDLLLADRTSRSPDTGLFGDAIKMLHDLVVYTNDFEPKLLASSQTFVADWSEEECANRQLPDYVRESVKLIKDEMKRCEVFGLDGTTRRALLTLLEDHLIERRIADLVDEKSFFELMDGNSTDDLEQLYSLLQRRRLCEKLKTPFSNWIDRTGTDIVFDEKQQDQMIPRLLELKQRLDHTWRFSFHKHETLGHILRQSFEAFINKSKKSNLTWNTDNSKPGEMVAKYVDQLLRAGAKAIPVNLTTSAAGVTPGLGKPEQEKPGVVKPLVAHDENDEDGGFDEDSEVNNQLDQVLDLFRFIHGKAVFEAFYKKDLARRLLMGRSASNDAERSMLARLNTECGSGFTQNLEQMFKDVELAREEMIAYKSRLEQNERKSDVDLSVNILSAAAWPTYPDIPVIIPPEIKKALDNFQNHYQVKHTGRNLYWKHALAHCQMKAAFPKANKEIVVSSFQAIVLLLFNAVGKDEHVSYERIKAESGLSEAEVKRTLQSLACAKLRPLTKHPRGRDINDTDTFSVNLGFEHPKYRVKINAIQLKETKEENKETHERVAADRQYETQAAIVRIMKSRKTIGHQQLIAETIKATKSRGTLQPVDIKKNIDKLIDKEYMEREEGGKYAYVA